MIALNIHLLIEDEVRGEVEHLGVGVFVGSPAEREGGETHPGILDQRDLVLNGQTAETWEKNQGEVNTKLRGIWDIKGHDVP